MLKQFSRNIRPGDKAVKAEINRNNLDEDAIHASATLNSENLLSVQILNTTKKPIQYDLQIKEQFAEVTVAANALQTVQIRLD